MIYEFTIPNYHPTPLNKLLSVHWSRRSRLKKVDRDMVYAYGILEKQIPPAKGKRAVTINIHLEYRQRAYDPDAYTKSLLDALVLHRLLTDDNRTGVQINPIEFSRVERTQKKYTTIILEDI